MQTEGAKPGPLQLAATPRSCRRAKAVEFPLYIIRKLMKRQSTSVRFAHDGEMQESFPGRSAGSGYISGREMHRRRNPRLQISKWKRKKCRDDLKRTRNRAELQWDTGAYRRQAGARCGKLREKGARQPFSFLHPVILNMKLNIKYNPPERSLISYFFSSYRCCSLWISGFQWPPQGHASVQLSRKKIIILRFRFFRLRFSHLASPWKGQMEKEA